MLIKFKKCNLRLLVFSPLDGKLLNMVTELQKYDSGILRNLGFAFLAPVGSIAFQGIVFNKNIFDGQLFTSIIVCVIGCILLYLGRHAVKEREL